MGLGNSPRLITACAVGPLFLPMRTALVVSPFAVWRYGRLSDPEGDPVVIERGAELWPADALDTPVVCVIIQRSE